MNQSLKIEVNDNRNYRLWFIGMLGCCAVLYFATISRNGFWYDEVMTALAGRLPFGEMILDRTTHGHLPLFFILSWIWQHFVGESEIVLRFFPVLLGLASACLLFLIVDKLTDAKTGFWAALMLLLNPEHIAVAQFARMYTLLLFIALCAIFLIIISEKEPRWQHRAGLYVLLSLLLYTHYSSLFVFSALIAYLLVRRRPCWKLGFSGLLAVLTFLPWLVYAFDKITVQSNLSLLRPYHILESVALWVKVSGTIQIFSYEEMMGGSIVLPALISLSTVSISVWATINARYQGRLFAILVIFPIMAVSVMGFLGLPNFPSITRYFITLVAAQAALFAIGLIYADVSYQKARMAAMLFLLVMNVGGTVGYFYNENGCFGHLKSGWRETAQTIEALGGPSERTYFVGGNNGSTTLKYYYSGEILNINALAKRWAKGEDLGPPSWENKRLLKAFELTPETTGCWLYVATRNRLQKEELEFIHILKQLMHEREEVPTQRGVLMHFQR